jgi:hypothetical protein
MKEIDEFIHRELAEWGIKFKKSRQDYLRKNISVGDDGNSLANSINLEYQIARDAHQETVRLLIGFEEHGRFIDMKTLKALIPHGSDNEYVREIIDWIQERKWESKFIEAFVKKRKLRRAPKKVLSQIAWSIIIARSKKVKPKKWWNKYKSAMIPQLINSIAVKLPDLTKNTLLNELL